MSEPRLDRHPFAPADAPPPEGKPPQEGPMPAKIPFETYTEQVARGERNGVPEWGIYVLGELNRQTQEQTRQGESITAAEKRTDQLCRAVNGDEQTPGLLRDVGEIKATVQAVSNAAKWTLGSIVGAMILTLVGLFFNWLFHIH